MDDGPPPLNCEITRGEEGSAPRVMGGNFIIDTTIELFDEGIAVGDTLDARHQVAAAGFDETYASNVNESIGRLFGSGLVPFLIPLPPGVVPGQQLVITVTMTSGAFAGSSCSESLEIL
jgi:hypothetical protein